ncbi:hypothetical protein AAG570_005176 [Ranatra chinensis]|uniref:Neprilysin n=1 Tax=Ranatra chinensis TaxID=642074 RepID=A0ABD0YI02_9HEMI
MDLSANPCDDFYQFSCGGFRRRLIPEDTGQVSTLGLIDNDLEDRLKTLVAEPTPLHGEPKHFANVRNLFKSCMDKDKSERDGTAWLEGVLEGLGGWPVVVGHSWDESKEGSEFSWLRAIYHLQESGFAAPYFTEMNVINDFKNTTTRIVNMDQPPLGITQKYLLAEPRHRVAEAYLEFMTDVPVLMGADRATAQTDMLDVFQFETELAKASLTVEERREVNRLYNPYTVREAQEKFPVIPWKEYINHNLPKNLTIDDNQVIVINDENYFLKLANILPNIPKRVLSNYLIWRTVKYSTLYMPQRFRDRFDQFFAAITGNTESEPRWKNCINTVASGLSVAVGSMYAKRYFKAEDKQVAMEITNNIRTEMYKTLETVDWMDGTTRQSALDKMKAMVAHIAYPDELLEDKRLAEYYGGMEINLDGPFLQAIINLTHFETQFEYGRLKEPVNKTEWLNHASAAVVNAYYNSVENSIEFPAGILQGAFFTSTRPRYMNYGTFGFVVAHEITHGFDDKGRLFDKDGNLKDWWDPDTKKRYLEKALCIVYQYGNYTDSQVNLKLNGVNTQGENIADNGGVKQAYRAYRQWLKSTDQGEPSLPGLDQFSPIQLFWISAANSWCSVYRDEELANRILTDVHSPGEFRVTGSISNMPEFSKDFNCPLGSRMNPVKKCNVW